MVSTNDVKDVILPNLSHGLIWLIFFLVAVIVLVLYSIPHLKKPKQKFRGHNVSIPVVNLLSLYIFTKLLEGVLYNGAIIKFDQWVNQAMVTIHSNWLTSIASFITLLGSGIPVVIITVVTIGTLFLMKRWRFALLSTAAMVGVTLIQLVIKTLVNRARPLNTLEVIAPGAFSASFPSGHAITAIVYVSLLVYSFKDDIKHVAVKYFLITLASSFFIIVGLTRIYLNAHWFSDVLAGMSLGLFWFMTLVLIERSITGLIRSIRKETQEAVPIKEVVPKLIKK